MLPGPKLSVAVLEKYLANQVSTHEVKVPMPVLWQVGEPEQPEPLDASN